MVNSEHAQLQALKLVHTVLGELSLLSSFGCLG